MNFRNWTMSKIMREADCVKTKHFGVHVADAPSFQRRLESSSLINPRATWTSLCDPAHVNYTSLRDMKSKLPKVNISMKIRQKA
jgi:hypothetical protein